MSKLTEGPVWVTGANGFLGKHLIRLLLEHKFKIVGFGRQNGRNFKDEFGAPYLEGGVCPVTLDSAITTYGVPSRVFHLAGGATVGQSIVDPLLDFRKSALTTAYLFDSLRKNAPSTPVVVTSSAAVYGAGHDIPIGIGSDLRPYSPYGWHKRIAEQLSESASSNHGQPVTVVRLFSVYGEGLRKQLPFDLCSKLSSGEKEILLGGTGSELREWGHASDVVRLLVEASKWNNGFRLVNGGGAAAASVREVAETIRDAWGTDCRISFTGKSRSGDPVALISDGLSIEGFEWSVPVKQGLSNYTKWFKSGQLAD